ncbi:hypothetical protein NDU88_007390 [Pleurodeles waltl]|uniref:Uncharacterized protein n=1 Tax=Pleurodeles waltl TaxID=8319 RepID=A0AAV7USQ8_PLEWA|nr:hypothetical protein NDU88_007390 [Pleurodeles waltl]
MCLRSRGGPIGSRAAPVSPILDEAPLQGRPQRVHRCPRRIAGSHCPSPGLGRLCRRPQAAPAAARFPTRGRGFKGEEGPQASTRSGRSRSGRNVPRVRRGGYEAEVQLEPTQKTSAGVPRKVKHTSMPLKTSQRSVEAIQHQ